MSNPILNDRIWNKAAKDPGWGAPDPTTRATPITDGPVSGWNSQVMTVSGTISASGVLMVILLATAVVGWQMGPDNSGGEVGGFPALALGGVLVGFACAIAMYFRPMWAKFLAPVYAVGEGFFLGVISKAYEGYQNGIVLQADARHGHDPVLTLRTGAEQFAQASDLDGQVALFDRGIGPDPVKQRAFGDGLAVGLKQGLQQGAGTLAKFRRLTVAGQAAAVGVKGEGAEGAGHGQSVTIGRRNATNAGGIAPPAVRTGSVRQALRQTHQGNRLDPVAEFVGAFGG